jgi:hypothetical protein
MQILTVVTKQYPVSPVIRNGNQFAYISVNICKWDKAAHLLPVIIAPIGFATDYALIHLSLPSSQIQYCVVACDIDCNNMSHPTGTPACCNNYSSSL